MINPIMANLDPEKIRSLEEKFGMSYRPSASQPNDEPTSKRTAKGKSLTSNPSKQVRVPGTTSAMRTRPNNPARDRKGFRQTSAYQANKTAQRSLETKKVEPQERPDKEEVRDRLLNPNNRHHTGNPVILNNSVIK